MQQSLSVNELQQMWGGWTDLLNRVYDDPKVAQLMNTRVGLYLSSQPFIALTVLLFITMAALPVGLFLVFALVTMIISAVGFVFVEVSLLLVVGGTLLCTLSGLALFSVLVSSIFNILYITIYNILDYYYPHLTKGMKVHWSESGCETSGLKEMK